MKKNKISFFIGNNWLFVIAIIMLGASIISNISCYIVTNESLVLSFVGVLATFVVIGNFAQTQAIKDELKKENEKFQKEINETENKINSILILVNLALALSYHEDRNTIDEETEKKIDKQVDNMIEEKSKNTIEEKTEEQIDEKIDEKIKKIEKNVKKIIEKIDFSEYDKNGVEYESLVAVIKILMTKIDDLKYLDNLKGMV